ncbi:replication factor A 51 kDa subunit-like [Galendromus occidentalis]|uniref:Replication factor A 51 kDa subunit-like n=1 Tax=Galendromus occidentalis TaxID=34638 RepID=A0AAJ6QWK1_9ACAR|nr:replication factor A 51 kDa subunit-like [Galendromus occidentalis]
MTKSDMKTFKKDNTDGNLFSFTLADNTADINVLVTGELGHEMFEKIQTGHCYQICDFKQRPSHPLYKVTNHTCELLLGKISEVRQIDGDHLPKKVEKYFTINQIRDTEVGKMIDLQAIIYDVGEIHSYSGKAGDIRNRQNILLVDDSRKIVSLTLWGSLIHKVDDREGQVVDFQKLSVKSSKLGRISPQLGIQASSSQ